MDGRYRAVLLCTSRGVRGYIVRGNLDAAKHVGSKSNRRVEFYNADIGCRLLEYELYEGTKRLSEPVAH